MKFCLKRFQLFHNCLVVDFFEKTFAKNVQYKGWRTLAKLQKGPFPRVSSVVFEIFCNAVNSLDQNNSRISFQIV